MDKERIIKTALTQWDPEDETFVTRSTEASSIVGVGETEAEALNDFMVDLGIQYQEWVNGTHGTLSPPRSTRKMGRPRTNRVKLNTHIAPETKACLTVLAKNHHKSIGQVIEILVEKAQSNQMTL
jgi:hypothetical protein